MLSLQKRRKKRQKKVKRKIKQIIRKSIPIKKPQIWRTRNQLRNPFVMVKTRGSVKQALLQRSSWPRWNRQLIRKLCFLNRLRRPKSNRRSKRKKPINSPIFLTGMQTKMMPGEKLRPTTAPRSWREWTTNPALTHSWRTKTPTGKPPWETNWRKRAKKFNWFKCTASGSEDEYYR